MNVGLVAAVFAGGFVNLDDLQRKLGLPLDIDLDRELDPFWPRFDWESELSVTAKTPSLRAFMKDFSGEIHRDIFHRRPVPDRLGGATFVRWRVTLSAPFEAVRPHLEARQGAPRTSSADRIVFGDHFVYVLDRGADGTCTLHHTTWDALPSSPRASADPKESAAAVERFLRGLPEAIPAAMSDNDWLALEESAPEGAAAKASIGSAAGSSSPRLTVKLRPSLEVRTVLGWWSIDRGWGRSVDVHMSVWRVELPTCPSPTGLSTDFTPIRFGPYEVRCSLEDRPNGSSIPCGPGRAYDLSTGRAKIAMLEVWAPRP